MNEMQAALLSDGSDGSSDRALIPILRWLLEEKLPEASISLPWVDLRALPSPPKQLAGRILAAQSLVEGLDLLFVHRDAEKESHGSRIKEIESAVALAGEPHELSLTVPVVPVRMHEAWLLIDEAAIRRAAGNPNSRALLQLPGLRKLELLSDPKDCLHGLLLDASETTGRRRKQFRRQIHQKAFRVAEHMSPDHFSRLRELDAFQAMERELDSALEMLGL